MPCGDRIYGVETMVNVARGSELLETMPREIEKAGVKRIFLD